MNTVRRRFQAQDSKELRNAEPIRRADQTECVPFTCTGERMNTPRYRYKKKAYEEIKAADPNTSVSLKMIDRLVKSGAVSSIPVGNGNRRLINLDELLAYFENPVEDKPEQVRGIRRIDERAGA